MNLLQIAATFFKVVTNLPVVIGTIKALVLAVEETGVAGEDKKDAVIQALIKTFKDAFDLDLSPYKAWIGWIIDGVVNIFNMTGYFKHAEKKS